MRHAHQQTLPQAIVAVVLQRSAIGRAIVVLAMLNMRMVNTACGVHGVVLA